MGSISLRLPEELDQKLAIEAELAGRARSEVVRHALTEYLAQRERERFLANIAAAARGLADDPDASAEALQIAEDFSAAEKVALDSAEGRQPGESPPDDSGGRWWK